MNRVVKNGDKRMTVREVAKALGCNPETLKGHIRELFPELMKNGITTYLTGAQVTVILEKMKAANRHYDSSRRNPTYNNIVAGVETSLSKEFRLAMLYKQEAEIMKEAVTLEHELRVSAQRELQITQHLLISNALPKRADLCSPTGTMYWPPMGGDRLIACFSSFSFFGLPLPGTLRMASRTIP